MSHHVHPSRLLIVVVNYRTPDLTTACLASLAADPWVADRANVVVVENGSGDDSAAQLRQQTARWPWVSLVVSEKNLGFAGGNNLGLRAAMGGDSGGISDTPLSALRSPLFDYVLLLNSDTIVQSGTLEQCIALMDREPRVGAMSCRVLNADGTVQNVARKFPSPLKAILAGLGLPWKFPRLFGWADTDDGSWDRSTQARDVAWLGGAFLMLRPEAFGGVIRLDEDFFFYGEDVEICHRAWQAGYRCHYALVGDITHLGGASSDPGRLPESDRSLHQWRARYLVQRKLYGRWAEWLVRGFDVLTIGCRLGKAWLRAGANPSRYHALRQQWRTISRPLVVTP